MREFHLIPGYLHVSVGNYEDAIFGTWANPLTTVTGVMTDGDIEEGVVIAGFLCLNWGCAFGVSWTGQLG